MGSESELGMDLLTKVSSWMDLRMEREICGITGEVIIKALGKTELSMEKIEKKSGQMERYILEILKTTTCMEQD